MSGPAAEPAPREEAALELALSLTAIGLFVWAALSDVAARRIPNRLVALLALVALMRLGLDLAAGAGVLRTLCDLALAAAVFAFGALLFNFGLFGGGDVKLLAAGALWLGAGSALTFFASTALAGGALALGFVLWIGLAGGRRPRPSLPYGVAIAAGGVLGTLAAL